MYHAKKAKKLWKFDDDNQQEIYCCLFSTEKYFIRQNYIMKLSQPLVTTNCPEAQIYEPLLSLDGKHILELGCGNADITRTIAETGESRKITALEVDNIAYEKNRKISDLPNVDFVLAGAQDIPLPKKSVDVVLMFKSLHHVPLDLMQSSMQEIKRVLKPGGLLYVSEPIFAGDFNDVLKMFHDEEKVRAAAFNTLQLAVNDGMFELREEIFFNVPMHFNSFSEFENNTINATHSQHALDEALYQQVKNKFEKYTSEDGSAHFLMPMRVDLLQCPS